MSEEKEKIELKLRLLTMNCMYISYKNDTLEKIFNGITSEKCFGLLEEKETFDKYSETFLQDLLLGYISQKDEDLKRFDSATDDYVSAMSNIVTKFVKTLPEI